MTKALKPLQQPNTIREARVCFGGMGGRTW